MTPYRLDQPATAERLRLRVSPSVAGVAAAVFVALAAAAAVNTYARSEEGCRVQVLTSEERIRAALAAANKAHGDRMAVFMQKLGLAE